MTWDYAELAHTAKEFGGPQGLVDAIYEGGVVDGFIDGGFKGVIVGALGTLTIGGIALSIKNAYDNHKLKTAKAKAALTQALGGADTEIEESNHSS